MQERLDIDRTPGVSEKFSYQSSWTDCGDLPKSDRRWNYFDAHDEGLHDCIA